LIYVNNLPYTPIFISTFSRLAATIALWRYD